MILNDIQRTYLNKRLSLLSKSKFRSSFHLRKYMISVCSIKNMEMYGISNINWRVSCCILHHKERQELQQLYLTELKFLWQVRIVDKEVVSCEPDLNSIAVNFYLHLVLDALVCRVAVAKQLRCAIGTLGIFGQVVKPLDITAVFPRDDLEE